MFNKKLISKLESQIKELKEDNKSLKDENFHIFCNHHMSMNQLYDMKKLETKLREEIESLNFALCCESEYKDFYVRFTDSTCKEIKELKEKLKKSNENVDLLIEELKTKDNLKLQLNQKYGTNTITVNKKFTIEELEELKNKIDSTGYFDTDGKNNVCFVTHNITESKEPTSKATIFKKQSELTQLSKEVHQNAVDHGWWEDDRPFGDIIALCHSELSEALEEYRNGHTSKEIYYNVGKPEGIPIELADCIIRILDYCGKENIDIGEAVKIKHEFNKSRPYKHGGKTI